jgi:hypothetical protein
VLVSEAANSNVASLSCVVPEGPAVIVVSGALTSTVHVRDPIAAFPAGSVARTRKVWEPSASGPA